MASRMLNPMIALLVACLPISATAQQATPADPARARTQFDFLIGTWKIKNLFREGVTSYGQGEIYSFTKLADQGSIEGDWQIDRGTPEKPRLVHTKLYSAYDNTGAIWSFYFVSELSAQYWPGTFEDGRWYFFHDFVIDGKNAHQRQWWEPLSKDSIRRHIENLSADGETYEPAFIATFARVGRR